MDKVAASAPKRSPTPDARDLRIELPLLGAPIPATSSVFGTSPPMSSLHSNHPRVSHDANSVFLDHELMMPYDMDVRPPQSRSINSHSAPSHGYGSVPYPVQNGMPGPGAYVPPSVPLSPYPPPQGVPYSYPHYPETLYSQYDTRISHHPPPRPPLPLMPEPQRMASISSMRPRENPYPILSPVPSASYHYSLETS